MRTHITFFAFFTVVFAGCMDDPCPDARYMGVCIVQCPLDAAWCYAQDSGVDAAADSSEGAVVDASIDATTADAAMEAGDAMAPDVVATAPDVVGEFAFQGTVHGYDPGHAITATVGQYHTANPGITVFAYTGDPSVCPIQPLMLQCGMGSRSLSIGYPVSRTGTWNITTRPDCCNPAATVWLKSCPSSVDPFTVEAAATSGSVTVTELDMMHAKLIFAATFPSGETISGQLNVALCTSI